MPVLTDPGHLFQRIEEGSTATSDGGSLLFGRVGKDAFPGPQGYLARAVPNRVVESHFHPVDQFQVMFGAPGAFYQRSAIPRVLVHYADAYSVYGPFGAGPDEELRFFTLRGEQSTLHGAMPEMRDRLLYRGERQHRVDIEPLLTAPLPTTGATVHTLFGPDPDGLAAYLMRLAAGATATPPVGEMRTGRYTVGIDGVFDVDGKSYTAQSLGWSHGEIDDVSLTAGPTGAAVLFLHLPYPASPVSHERALSGK
jgi:hypothetical protein